MKYISAISVSNNLTIVKEKVVLFVSLSLINWLVVLRTQLFSVVCEFLLLSTIKVWTFLVFSIILNSCISLFSEKLEVRRRKFKSPQSLPRS